MVNPFALQQLVGPLPRLGALSKAVFLVCLGIVVMRLGFIPGSILFALILGLGVQAGLGLKDGAAAGRGLFILLAFSALARGLFPGDGRCFAVESLGPSSLYALRLGTIFAAARLFYASTRVSELGDYLSAAYRFVCGLLRRAGAAGLENNNGDCPRPRKTPTQERPASLAADPGMMLSLSLVFVPRTFESYRRIREAAECRGFGAGKRRLFSGLALLQALLFSSVKNSLRTAEAMEARAYSPGRRIILPRLRPADLLLMASGLSLAVLSFF
ncbi:MAG: energy-coupling factor transporter transmembrane component T [Spirochaetales bacterium]|nr:energy-coupling factor transporter transmembrane component T [Spirochaetales bacterium]